MPDAMKELPQPKLIDWWWLRVPMAARRISLSLSAVLTDGLYLTAWPQVGAIAPPLSLLIGFLLGWLRFTPGNTFTFSIYMMALMLVVSSLGAGLGAWLWTGYVIGDFFLFRSPLV